MSGGENYRNIGTNRTKMPHIFIVIQFTERQTQMFPAWQMVGLRQLADSLLHRAFQSIEHFRQHRLWIPEIPDHVPVSLLAP
jgi:hypothetical protein